jgi:hypothetical protein
MIWILSIILNAAWASDALVAHLESKAYRLNGKLVVSSQENELLNGLKQEGLLVESLPTIGNKEAEIERLHNKYQDHCLIVLHSNDSDTKSPISGVSFTEIGNCDVDPNLRFTVQENGSQWSVINNRQDTVSVHTFATVCEDLPLQARLNYEEKVSNRNARILYYGSVGLAVGSLFTTGNQDPGFSVREENRFWSSVFLLGSAAMLYTQRDIPYTYKIARQKDLQNYYSLNQVQKIIDRTFPPIVEELLEVQEDGSNDTQVDVQESVDVLPSSGSTSEPNEPPDEVEHKGSPPPETNTDIVEPSNEEIEVTP